MVRIYENGLPQIQYSVRTSYADIGFQLAADGRRAVIVSCLDNLAEGRVGAGGAEHERDARLGRSGGAGMKYVVKLGGAGLEVPALLEGCVRAITELVRDGHQVAVVHGGGVQLTTHAGSAGQEKRIH